MTKKLGLSELAALAEVTGTAGVIASLVFVVVQINNNTIQASAATTQAFFKSFRELEMVVAADPSWSKMVAKGRTREADPIGTERFRYDT